MSTLGIRRAASIAWSSVVALDHVVAAELLARLGEGPVGHLGLAVAHPHRRRRRRGLQGVAAAHDALVADRLGVGLPLAHLRPPGPPRTSRPTGSRRRRSGAGSARRTSGSRRAGRPACRESRRRSGRGNRQPGRNSSLRRRRPARGSPSRGLRRARRAATRPRAPRPAGRPGCGGRTPPPPPAGGPGRRRRGCRRPGSARAIPDRASSPSKAAERGMPRRAAATASGCSWRAMRCRITVRTDSRQRSSRVSGPRAARKPSGPPASSPAASRSQRARSALGRPEVGRGDEGQGPHALGVGEREGDGGGRAHRLARDRPRASIAGRVHHRHGVAHELVVGVGLRARRRATRRRGPGRRRRAPGARRARAPCEPWTT